MEDVIASLGRPVRLLGAGGTISMQGERAVPSLDPAQLIEALPPLSAVPELHAEAVLALPGAQIDLELLHRALVQQQCAVVVRANATMIVAARTDVGVPLELLPNVSVATGLALLPDVSRDLEPITPRLTGLLFLSEPCHGRKVYRAEG